MISKIREHLAQRPANMGFDRQSIDLRHALVDTDEAIVQVHQDEADGGILIDLLYLSQLLSNVAV